MTIQEFVRFANDCNRIFSVEFTKRSTGELRLMNCRRKVLSHLTGGDAAYDAPSKNLMVVFDMNKNQYRSLPLEGIVRVKVDGVWIPVK